MSEIVNEVRKSFYLDSVALMRLSAEICALGGIEDAVLMTGTATNQKIMQDAGLLNNTGATASANDLIIALRADGESSAIRALAMVEKSLQGNVSKKTSGNTQHYSTLTSAINALPDMNLALISTPGAYAAREAHTALDHGMNVMIFSDNISIETELKLKRKAQALDLLVMGPDCGTAYINSTPLAFANDVPQGNISAVAASGTGLQEFSVLLTRLGSGIRHGIGVGGRDMTDEIGAISTLMAIDLLAADQQTDKIVLISKPPGKQAAHAVFEKLAHCGKPSIACLFGFDREISNGVAITNTLLGAAEFASGKQLEQQDITLTANTLKSKLSAGQKHLKGLFTGGTLCTEAHLVLQSWSVEVGSNAVTPNPSTPHQLVDLGADEYTLGKPHPMLEPSVRTSYLIEELNNPTNAVIMLDIVLGYGAHHDPASEVCNAIQAANNNSAAQAIILASVCGTDKDPQNYHQQCNALEQAGVTICRCNSEMAALGAAIITQIQ